VGCGNGAFTEMLVGRCRSTLHNQLRYPLGCFNGSLSRVARRF